MSEGGIVKPLDRSDSKPEESLRLTWTIKMPGKQTMIREFQTFAKPESSS
jgi:hypothetical protein